MIEALNDSGLFVYVHFQASQVISEATWLADQGVANFFGLLKRLVSVTAENEIQSLDIFG